MRYVLHLFSLSKGNSQREAQAAREAQQQLVLVQSEVQRLEGELDTARRERDTLQLEMSLVQVSRQRVPDGFIFCFLFFLMLESSCSVASDPLGVTADIPFQIFWFFPSVVSVS